MTMRLFFSGRGNARLEHADERIVDNQLVIFRNDLEDVEVIVLSDG